MRKTLYRLGPLLVVMLVIPSCCTQGALSPPPGETQGLTVGNLVQEVQRGLARAKSDLEGKNLPPLKSVTLNLVAEATGTNTSNINLVVASLGSRWEKAFSQEIELTLVPPKTKEVIVTGAPKQPSIADQLAAAIVSALQGVKDAPHDVTVPLTATSLKVVIAFVVKWSMDVGTKGGFQVVPVTVDLGCQATTAATQKITVVFENP